ncbi:MAG: alpha/beta hydrolase [Clostridia bacterium]|nr:alpha/beta hydrolase [Clostridia bacterium]
MPLKIALWTFGVLIALAVIVLIASFICYMRVFYSPKRKPMGQNDFPLPPGDIYKPYYPEMIEWMKTIRAMPHETITIKSHDGLSLSGNYYEYKPGAPIELLFHGYQGCGERDLSAGVERCFAIGRSAVIIDQRSHGASEGRTTTFGIKERFDCLTWIEYITERFGKDTKIILTGVSMGAATVMMAAGEKLPENVVCVLADCGYSSAKAIIKKVIREMGLPADLLYPFVRLGAFVFGGFKLEETSPLEAVKRANVPIIFIHGDNDAFVPHSMSAELYEACASKHKKFVISPGAGHGIAYPVNKELYIAALRDFEEEAGFLK